MAALLATAAVALAVVAQDGSGLRAAPAANAPVLAPLPAGELVEVRGRRLDHLQVWDPRLERGGYVRASQVRTVGQTEADARDLLAVVRFVRDTPGSEALGIALVAAYLRAAPAAAITAEPFDALGTMAERLARRASGKSPGNALAQMEVAGSYGVRFASFEQGGAMRFCYDGDAFTRVAAMPSATAGERARAALALTRFDCIDPAMAAHERAALDRWRAGLLDRLPAMDVAGLDPLDKNRLHLRRAAVWSTVATAAARRGEPAQAAARRALDELAAVDKTALSDDDQADAAEAAIRVGAMRWAAEPPKPPARGRLQVETAAGEPGQTCVRLVDGGAKPLAERCTFAIVWPGSAAASPDGRALALAVQPQDGWRELWVFHVQGGGWAVDILPPAASDPGLGYVEFAGWVPGGQPRLLDARESLVDGRVTRRFEVLALDTLAVETWAGAPERLPAFGRFADPQWKRATVSVR